MIFRWLKQLVLWLLWFIIPPPRPTVYPKINPNEMCPACGAEEGTILAVELNGITQVQHKCKVCQARWNSKPIVETKKIQPPSNKEG